jgi:ABC-type transport system involved in cytochrome c biogenesis permease component
MLNSPIIIHTPRWEWILDITILPILLPALMFAVWWILSKIFIWIKKGFVGQN